jgi:ketosteroid isomerase-like protein
LIWWGVNEVTGATDVVNDYFAAIKDGDFDAAADLACDYSAREVRDDIEITFGDDIASYNFNTTSVDNSGGEKLAVVEGTVETEGGDEFDVSVFLEENNDGDYCVSFLLAS